MKILVTLNEAYLYPLSVMLKSLALAHPATDLEVYLINSTLRPEHFDRVEQAVGCNGLTLVDIKIDDSILDGAPVTDRYPKEMYYRIFAAQYLPSELDRILYLDPDLVVLRSLEELYHSELDYCFYAAAGHLPKALEKLNGIRLQSESPGPYINSGVMLMNLERLRQEQDQQQVFDYIQRHKNALLLPDQDVISALYGDRILPIDPWKYNMTERLLWAATLTNNGVDFAWVKQNSCIVHYCGRNKPWKERYVGRLNQFFNQFAQQVRF